MALVRFKADFMCQFSFAFKKLANAWLNLKGRCEDGRGRRAERERGEATSQNLA